MIREIKINKKAVRVDNSCGFLVAYLNQFNSDPLIDISDFRKDPFMVKSESKIIILKLFWALAKNYNKKIKSPEKWLKKMKIDYFELAGEIFNILTAMLKVDEENEDIYIDEVTAEKEELKTTHIIASALAYGFSINDFCKMDLGNYIKICREYAKIKGYEPEERQATQSDFDNF